MSSQCKECTTFFEQIYTHKLWWRRFFDIGNLLILGIGIGLIFLYKNNLTHIPSIPWETLVLVIFLGTLLSFTRIWQFFPKNIPAWGYIPLAGVASAFMDSFLVLVILISLAMEGSEKELLIFRAYAMMAALIGGLLTYFGEVYALPIALMYGMREWYSMLWIAPPVIVFLGILTFRGKQLKVSFHCENSSCRRSQNPFERGGKRWRFLKLSEFVGFILILLIWKDPVFCMGILLTYYALWGYGFGAWSLLKYESETVVILLLVFIGIWGIFLDPYMTDLHFGWIILGSVVNAVAMATMFPATGNVYMDIFTVSVAVLVTPISSLVGVIVFRSLKDWWGYTKTALPWVVLWGTLLGGWITIFEGTYLEVKYYEETGFEKPSLIEKNLDH